jgi:hypothetical protein
MVRELLAYLLTVRLLLALFAANDAFAQPTNERCTSCVEQRRLLVPLSCSSISEPAWSLSSPFAVPEAVLPPVLRNWCLMTAPHGTPRPTLGVPVSADLPNVFPQSSGFASVLWPSLNQRFLAQSSALQGLPLEDAALAPVDVAVIDDAWNRGPGEPGDGYRRHGRTLGLIIRELTCPDGQYDACPLYLSNHRALRCDEGRSGTRVHLARAIYEAVIAWQQRESTRTSSAKLIINLSIGFEDDGMIDTLLVQNAIEVATCHGALVVAAAGNLLPNGSGSGPLLPGGFASLPVPADCSAHALPDARGFEAAPLLRPLVEAASGLEARDVWLPLLTTRPGGRPAIAAPGFHAVAGDPLTGTPFGASDVLTGSSVATAVTSAIAALVWAHVPALEPIDVVASIKSSSEPLGEVADFGLAPYEHENIGLAGACSALVYACNMWSTPECIDANVAALSCVPPSPAIVPWPSIVVETTYFPGNIDTCVQPANSSVTTTCTRMSARHKTTPSCPADLRVVGPQPGDLGCGACALKASTRSLYIAIDSTYEGDFIAKEVSIKRLDGVTVQPFKPLDLPVLRAGDKLQVLLELRTPSEQIPAAGQAMLEVVATPYETYRVAPIEWW